MVSSAIKDEYVIYRGEKMKKYTAIYLISRGERSPHDILYCSSCYKVAKDVHHLLGRIGEKGGVELLYHPKYLSVLCRKCHNKIELNELDGKKIYEREQKKIKILLDDYSEYFTPCE